MKITNHLTHTEIAHLIETYKECHLNPRVLVSLSDAKDVALIGDKETNHFFIYHKAPTSEAKTEWTLGYCLQESFKVLDAKLSGSGDSAIFGGVYYSGLNSKPKDAALIFHCKKGVWRPSRYINKQTNSQAQFATKVAISREGDVVAISHADCCSTAMVFEEFGATWVHKGTLRGHPGGVNKPITITMSPSGEHVCIGSPEASEGAGQCVLFSKKEGEWKETKRIVAPTAVKGFASRVEFVSTELHVYGYWSKAKLTLVTKTNIVQN